MIQSCKSLLVSWKSLLVEEALGAELPCNCRAPRAIALIDIEGLTLKASL